MAKRKRNTGERGPHRFLWQVILETDRAALRAHDKKYFQGETMTCILCGRQEQSDPEVESQWRLLKADGVPYYVCPAEFPPDDASSEAFAAAYMTAPAKIGQMREEKHDG